MKEDNNQNLENAVMGKIKSGQVKLRSKYIFIAEKLGLDTALTLSFVLASLLFNLIFFYVKETDNLKYLSFGKDGIFAFLESFPYLIVIAFILFIVLASYLISKSESLYKRSFGQLVVFLIISITFFGAILTYTNVAERIEKESFKNEAGRFFRPFVAPPEIRDNGMSGVIYEKGDNYLILKTPRGLMNMDIGNIEKTSLEKFKVGEFVISIGQREGKNFVASKISIVRKEDIPSETRRIDYKFQGIDEKKDECPKDVPPDIMYFEEEKKECIKECLNSGKCIKDCFAECINQKGLN
jgi:hypothetical protein